MPKNEEEKGKVSFNPVDFRVECTPGWTAPSSGKSLQCLRRLFFPQPALCTQCFAEGSLKEHPLKNQGTLYSFTIEMARSGSRHWPGSLPHSYSQEMGGEDGKKSFGL